MNLRAPSLAASTEETRQRKIWQAAYHCFVNLPIKEHVVQQVMMWKQEEPRFATQSRRKSRPMQRQFTIELRVDYADNDKNAAMQEAVQRAARHVLATAALLADGVKPQIAAFSDDFFTGHKEIAVLEDTIAKGRQEISGGGIDPAADEGVSSELLGALAAGTSGPADEDEDADAP